VIHNGFVMVYKKEDEARGIVRFVGLVWFVSKPAELLINILFFLL